jgi:hypothetical protein
MYKASMEEARCGAVFPGDTSKVAHDSRVTSSPFTSKPAHISRHLPAFTSTGEREVVNKVKSEQILRRRVSSREFSSESMGTLAVHGTRRL